jgi:O-antigen/teichoic acid export membrane protein
VSKTSRNHPQKPATRLHWRLASLLRELLRRPQAGNAAALVAARVAGLLIPLISFPLLAHALNTEGLGLLAFVQAVAFYLCMIIDFGFNQSAVTSAAHTRSQPARLREIFWSIAAFRAVLLTFALMVLFCLALYAARSAQERTVYMIATLNLVGIYLSSPWLYQGIDRGAVYALGLLIPRAAQPILIWLLVKTPHDLTAATVILFGTDLVAGAGLFCFGVLRLVPGPPTIRLATAVQEARLAFDAWVVTLAAALMGNIAPLALRLTGGLAGVGTFAVADKIVRGVVSCFLPVAQTFQGEASLLAAAGGRGLDQLSRQVSLLLEVGAAVFIVATFLLSGRIVAVLFGPAFAGSAPILRVYSLLAIPAALTAVIGTFDFVARRRTRAYRRIYLGAAIFHVALVFLLARTSGSMGVAVSASITECILVIALIRAARPQRHDPVSRMPAEELPT